MVFSSHFFLFVFLPLVLALYYLSPRGLKHPVLTVLSYVFYGWSNPLFVVLMFVSTIIDYIAGRAIASADPRNQVGGDFVALEEGGSRSRSQRMALWASMISNLSLLGFFKYYNFGIENVTQLFAALGWDGPGSAHFLHVVLPLGISFYTFQSMSYSIDVYRGHARALRSFPDFACYIALFPQLVAGPIIRYQDVADQMFERSHTSAKFVRGIAFFGLGLAKKVLLANPCGRIADTVYESVNRAPSDAWSGMFSYAMQIYFDFSAYSDMAVGLGLMFGFVFIKNFDSPYRSLSVTEFWQRWHISLSTWLRDYLYIPLGGNRRGPVRTYINLMTVMLLGGLWHGASWNFVLWGGGHGLWLVMERFWKERDWPKPPCWARLPLTFLGVSLLWIPFRAPDFATTLAFYTDLLPDASSMTSFTTFTGAAIRSPYLLGSMVLAGVVAFFGIPSWQFTRQLPPWKLCLVLLMVVGGAAMLSSQSYNPFIYFIF
ncbi:MAG: Peptidoglycan O-acetyltransferase [Verrucomicrobiota bacterium]|jgi:alginate O-acetyltransferase complex protein AlgI